MRLLATFILRPLNRDRLRTALTILAVALGVAVVVAIELAGEAATGSFRSSLETLVGTVDLEVVANGHIDESWVARLTVLPLNARFAPVIETVAEIPGAGSVTLYGMDMVAAAQEITGKERATPEDSIVLSEALAQRLRITKGNELSLRLNDGQFVFHVAAVAKSGATEFAALDIAAAQRILDAYGKLDRIDVYVSPAEDIDRVERKIRATVPPGYFVRRPGARSEENQRMLRAFRWNLRVLSYISLVVGAFLIYNTIAVSVVRRRPEIGILRALGANRGTVFRLFLGEALLLGAAGSILGVLLGRALAEAVVGLIAETVNSLYVTSRPAPIHLTAGGVLTGVLGGIAVAVLAALGPARDAMDIAPTEAMARGAHEHHIRLRWPGRLAAGGLIAALAWLASRARPIEGNPVGGYIAALLAIAAAALAAPAFVLLIETATRRLSRKLFGAEGLLAGRSLTGSLARTSIIVAALATAIAMMASVGIMVGSFRETVLVWLDSQLRADLYLRPLGRTGADQHPPLDPRIETLLKSVSGVAAVDVFHALEFRYRGERATLGAGESEIVRRYGRLRFLPGQDRDAILRSLPGTDRAIVSEPFANRFNTRAGDRLKLALGDRAVTVTVAGVYYDYSTSQGYVVLDRRTLLRYLPGQPPTNMAVYLAPGADSGRVRRAIEKLVSPYHVVVAPNDLLRRNALRVFDRTFAITYALEAVAIVVAMLGAANSLLALVLDRRREFGLLRYLGASGPQVRRMVLVEAGLLGLLGNLLGLALGVALSLLLVFVVNKQSFGWTIQFDPPQALLAGALLLVWCVAIAAGLYPARVASRLNPIDVIHEE